LKIIKLVTLVLPKPLLLSGSFWEHWF